MPDQQQQPALAFTRVIVTPEQREAMRRKDAEIAEMDRRSREA